MRVQETKAVTIVLNNGKTKTYVFETEKEALETYSKYRTHTSVKNITIGYTNTLKTKKSC